uniref:G domain-containing protein n=1 Tax=Lates calcarifer TaxID=8187 RepID=A0A4W6DRG8_LATCA
NKLPPSRPANTLQEKQRDLQYVQEYRPENGDIKHLRILLYGPVGGGKSSFINSVSTVMRGRTTIPAAASATTSDTSFTRQKRKRKPKDILPAFVFNDMMGLEEGSDSGVRADDIKLSLVKIICSSTQNTELISVSAGIPQMAIVTNIDTACGEIEKDLKNVYKSKHLRKKFSKSVGIPMNCICPVKNYSDEIEIDDDVDSLILSALRLMIHFGDDFIEDM